jgi:predicted DNA binding CopG/RHH family protein
MTSKKVGVGAKPKAVSTVAYPKEQANLNSENGTLKGSVPHSAETPVPEKAGKGKKAQASKKVEKEQKVLAEEPAKKPAQEPVETPMEMRSPTQAKAGKAKVEKTKAAKAIAQAALEEPAAESAAVSQKSTLEPEKATKMKRLTLDIAKPLHKAIKARAVEEGVPMVDMLRSLLTEYYSK